MKKLLTSKPFLVSALAFASIAIVAVCIFISGDKQPEFVPESPQQTQSVSDWSESSGAAKPSVPANTPAGDPKQEAYPKVAEENDGNVVIDFTPPQSSAAAEQPEPPEIPEGKTEVKDPGPSHPVNPDPSVKAPEPEPEQPSGPTPGSTNDKGQVYDPVFGWITPSTVQQEVIDGDGDPNKMVGSMD
ncbi:MAG: hypothetical protein LIP16_15100 [Clostridium sp.]|nr:hypothetical protein [Clostridium sp.]